MNAPAVRPPMPREHQPVAGRATPLPMQRYPVQVRATFVRLPRQAAAIAP